MRGEQPQIGADLIGAADRLVISAHASLIGDDPAESVEHLLAVRFEQREQRRRPTGVQVGGPHHGVAVRRDKHRRDQIEEGTFVVVNPLRQDHRTCCIDRDAVVGVFAGIDATQSSLTKSLPIVVPVVVPPCLTATPAHPYPTIGARV